MSISKRMELLQDVYDKATKANTLKIGLEVVRLQYDTDLFHYEYLLEKGFITVEVDKKSALILIKTDGIDAIETYIEGENNDDKAISN